MKKLQGHVSLIIAVIATLAAMIVTGLSGDYFFDLNDDVLIKDILSGAYTGAPEGHNIQMLYPISLFISLFYRLGVNIDWYGIFLCGLQYLCFGVVVFKSVELTEDVRKKAVVALAEFVFIMGFFMPHLLFVQYTVVCGVLSATAAFLIITADEKGIENSLALVFIIVAFLLRSEMLLLTLPMVGVAILIKFLCVSKETGNINSSLGKYTIFCIVIIGALLIGTFLNNLAYSSPEWKEFNRFFDNRTELYDFQFIPDYAENREFYESIGLSESQQKLLTNYNFGLDDSINADVLAKVAEYAKSIKGEEAPFFVRLKDSVKQYIYRLHHVETLRTYEYPMTDFPWNILVLILYPAVLVVSMLADESTGSRRTRLGRILFFLITLFACRTALWLFIIIRGRDPIRITHPLYLVEILILLGMLLNEERHGKKASEVAALVAMAVMLVIGVFALPMQLNITKKEQLLRSEMLANYGKLEEYVRNHDDSFFFYDVYTSVSYASVAEGEVATYSEKLFENVDNSCYNRDILGGWASKSPLAIKKLKDAGFDNASEALLEPGSYFVQNKTESVDWLVDFYVEKGMDVRIIQEDTVADIFGIYSISEN